MIVWINGAVGVGKSHVAQKLAELLAEKGAEYIESDLYWINFLRKHFIVAPSFGVNPYCNIFFLIILRKAIEERIYGFGKMPIASMSLVTKLCKKELLDYFKGKNIPMLHIILEAAEETIISRIENDPGRDKSAKGQQIPKISRQIEYLGTEYPDAVRINTENKSLDKIVAEILALQQANICTVCPP